MNGKWFTPDVPNKGNADVCTGTQGLDQPSLGHEQALSEGWVFLDDDGTLHKRDGAADAQALRNLRGWLKSNPDQAKEETQSLLESVKQLLRQASNRQTHDTPETEIASLIRRLTTDASDTALGNWLRRALDKEVSLNGTDAKGRIAAFHDIKKQGQALLRKELSWTKNPPLADLYSRALRLEERLSAIALEIEQANNLVLAAFIGAGEGGDNPLPSLPVAMPFVELSDDPYVYIANLRQTLVEGTSTFQAQCQFTAAFPQTKDFFKAWDSTGHCSTSISRNVAIFSRAMATCETAKNAENILHYYAGHEIQRSIDVLSIYTNDMSKALDDCCLSEYGAPGPRAP